MQTATVQQPNEQAILLSVRQVAELLSIGERTVYQLADAGKIPRPRKVGGSNRWLRSEIVQWANEGCQPLETPKRKAKA